MFGKVTVIGPGLLGGSLCLALSENKMSDRIVLWARTKESCQNAQKIFPFAEVEENLAESGVDIGHYITKPCRIHQRSARHIDIELTEGKNRQIRRMLEALCNRVHRLTRVQFGDILLGDLKPGNYRILTDYAIPVQNKQQ